MPRLLSGRVGLTSYAGLSTSRNQIVGSDRPFVIPGSFEPNLDKPSVNNQVLYADADGTRRWGDPGGTPTGVVSGFTVEDEGLTPVGLGGSIAIMNFIGDGVSVAQTFRNISGALVGVATVNIPRIDFNAEDGSGFVQVTGVSTLRVGVGLTVIAPAGTTGIASIGNITENNLDIYDTSSYLSITNVGALQVGTGLSVTENQVNRAKFDVTGNFPNINISGISSIGQGFSTTMYTSGISTADAFIGITSIGAPNFYGNFIGDVTGNLTGKVSGNLTGDVYAGIVTATKTIVGNINATGVSTISQLKSDTVDVVGVTTASGFVADVNGFLGSINYSGISTLGNLQSTNINASGIVTANIVSGFDYLKDSGDKSQVNIQVTVASKTTGHRYHGTGSGSAFYFDGTESPFLILQPGRTYRFTQTDSSNSGHPLRFYYDAGKQRTWSDTVTTNGVPGNSGAYTQLVVQQETPHILYYQCTNHGFMGNAVSCDTNIQYGDINSVGVITASQFVGPLIGNVTGNITGNITGTADSATEVDIQGRNTSSTLNYIPFVEGTGNQRLGRDTALKYLPSSNELTAGFFIGNGSGLTNLTSSNLVGDLPAINGSALTNVGAATVNVIQTNSTNATYYIGFVDSASGQEPLRSDGGLTYNPNSNTLTVANVTASLSGDATGLSGTPSITVGNITSYNILPASNNTYDLGTTSNRFSNIYTNDLHLSNEGSVNSVDSTWGDWTLQEGEEDIFMINNRSGKKYKINLTEV